MFYKIPLDADLSKTSYRDRCDTETNAFIEYNEGFVGNDWEEITEEEYMQNYPQQSAEPEPYQPTNAEVAQMISDLQADLIIAGVI